MESLSDFSDEFIIECANRYINIWYILRRPWLFPFALTDFKNGNENTVKLRSRFGFILSHLVGISQRIICHALWHNTIKDIVKNEHERLNRLFKHEVERYPDLFKRYKELSEMETLSEELQLEYDKIIKEHGSIFILDGIDRNVVKAEIEKQNGVRTYVKVVKILNGIMTIGRSLYDLFYILYWSGIEMDYAFIVNADYNRFRLFDEYEENIINKFRKENHFWILYFYQTGYKNPYFFRSETIDLFYKILPMDHIPNIPNVDCSRFEIGLKSKLIYDTVSDHAREVFVTNLFIGEISSECEEVTDKDIMRQDYLYFKRILYYKLERAIRRENKDIDECLLYKKAKHALENLSLSAAVKALPMISTNRKNQLPLSKTIRELDELSPFEIHNILKLLNVRSGIENIIRSRHPCLSFVSDRRFHKMINSFKSDRKYLNLI